MNVDINYICEGSNKQKAKYISIYLFTFYFTAFKIKNSNIFLLDYKICL